MDVFQYSPLELDRPALRLVRLRAARAGPEIDCEFIEAFFDEDHVPDYEAISYTWGSMRTPAEIKLNGSKFAVTKNLLSVLQDVRYEDEDRILWIDAVCINQGSHSELGHQVQQMDQIYRRAYRVIIWLGLLTEPISLLMDSLADLHRQIPGIDWPPTDPRWQISRNRLKDSSTENLTTLAQTFMDILERPWFRRVWVIQEVANARAAVVHCGPKSITARIFAAGPNLLDVGRVVEIEKSKRKRNAYAHCQAILDIMPGPSRKGSWWTPDIDLGTLLKKFSNTKATREHDRVFALFGLCTDANAEIPVDYTQTIGELARKVMLHICPASLKHLEFINYTTVEDLIKDSDRPYHKILASLLADPNPGIMTAFIFDHREQLTVTENLLLAAMATTHGMEYRFLAVLELYRGYDTEKFSVARVLPLVVVYGGIAVVEDLLQRIPDLDLGVRSKTGSTALTEASTIGDLAVVKLLLGRGVDCNRADASSRSPLECAIRNEKLDVVRHLIDAGADLEGKFSYGGTVLIEASSRGYEDIVMRLLERDAECDQQDSQGNTPVMEASKYGFDAIFRLLCDKGADCTQRNVFNETPLFLAAKFGHKAVVELLLERGVDFETKDCFRQTPLSIAQTKRYYDIVRLFQLEKSKRGGAARTEEA